MALRMLIRVAIVLITMVAAASAQRAPFDLPEKNRGQAGTPGQFDYYTLSLSWSPTYCAGPQGSNDLTQCRPRGDKRYAFVLHGLWPQYERGYPQFCRTRERPFVPNDVIQRMQDIMPSPKLTIHEYRRHGTCSGLDPATYYDLARTMFARIKIPARYLNPATHQFVGGTELVREFMAANPGLARDGIAVSCGSPANRLREVRICFTREGEFRRCGANELGRQLCRSERMHVPPVRPAADTPNNRDSDQPRDILPGPGSIPPGQRSL